MLDIFKNSNFDDKIILIRGNEQFSRKKLKCLIASQTEILKQKKENVVILNGDNFSFVVNFFSSIFAGKNIFLITDSARLSGLDFEYDIAELKEEKYTENYNFKEISPKDTIINFYTSGSTGTPKVIQKSLYNLIEEGSDLGKVFNIEKETQVFSTTTMCHLFGMTFHLMFALCNELIINTNPITYPENVDNENCILVSTPAFLKTKVKHDLMFKKSPKYIISAGSKLDTEVYKVLEKESKVIEIYGSTETGVIAYKTQSGQNLRIFPNVKVKSNDDSTEVFSNYAFGGTALINDKVECLNGELIIKSRTDRLFKINEKRISAQELEEKLNLHGFVEESYIIKSGEKLACLCALSQEGKAFLPKKNTVELTKTLKSHLSDYSEIIPQRWKFIDKIPVNTVGKIDKKLIEHLFDINLSLPVILDRKEEKNSITYRIFMYRNCNFFNGHFPTFKLVPGVVQLYIAKELANIHFGFNIGQGQLKRIKFSNIIEPDSIIHLKLVKSEKQVSYEYFSEEKKFASGVFEIENIFEKQI